MKKIALLVVICLLATAAWGCGRESTQGHRKADLEADVLPLLEDSIRAMSELRGYRLKGSMEMSAGGGDASGSGTLRMDMRAEVENTEGGTNQHIHMEMGGLATEAYIYGDYFYQEVPGQGWVKSSLAQYQAQNLSTGVINEEQMRLIAETVREATVRDEGGDEMEMELVLGEEFLLRSLERFRDEAGEAAGSQMEQWVSVMEEAAWGFSATLRLVVGKQDRLIRKMEMNIEMREVPQLGTYKSTMHTEAYDYNADIHVELPPEAEKATLSGVGSVR